MHGELVERYRARTPRSHEMWHRATRSLPGGDTRTGAYFHPYPPVIESGVGGLLTDVDGNEYIDLNCNGAALIHGQCFAPVIEALEKAMGRGTAWSGTSRAQIAVAEELRHRTEAFELVRFTATGTEAGNLAVKLARKATGRPAILKALGGYHGAAPDLEHGLFGKGEDPGRVMLARYGDAADFERILNGAGDQVAAVIVEPFAVDGVVVPPPDFLPRIREAVSRAGALLVFDECITYRSAWGGVQREIGVAPDLTMVGKWLGGGLPLAAVAGREKVLRHLDPREDDHMYHAGSYNGSYLSTIAAEVTLGHLDLVAISRMNDQAERLAAALEKKARTDNLHMSVTCRGSMLAAHFFTDKPTLPAAPSNKGALALFHLAALLRGVYFFPNDGMLTMSTALTDEQLERAETGLLAALDDLAGMLSDPGVAAAG